MLELIYDSGNLKAWLLEDHLVISKFPEPELHLWNQTAAAVWLLLLEGHKSLNEIALEINEIFSNCHENIESELIVCLSEWVNLGWLELNDSLQYFISPINSITPHVACEVQDPVFSHSVLNKNYCINQNIFCININSQFAFDSHPFLSRFNSLTSGFIETFKTPSYTLDIVIGNESIFLGENFKNYKKLETQEEALSHCIQFFLKASSNNLAHFLTLHAAGIGKEHCLILPGMSGSGKSTLCALLALRGWKYFGDDLIGLAVNEKSEGYLIPLPTGVSIKSDNWDLLFNAYPDLEKLEIIKYGNKVARFLALPNSPTSSKDTKLIRSLVFPSYSKNSQTIYTQLSATESLTKLVDSGVSLHKDMCPEEVEHFLRFLTTNPIYQLTYSDIDEVNTWLSTLIRN